MRGDRRMKSWMGAFIAIMALAGCGPAGEGTAFSPSAPSAFPSQAPSSGSVNPVQDPSRAEYRIATDDILQIVVYQVQDFNRDAQVDAAGNIALPLLGSIPARGRTTHDVENDISRRLKAKYIQNPQVSVMVKDAIGMRVIVEGSVTKPGVIGIRGNTTLLNVLAQSGGFTDTADHSGILVFRNTANGREVARFDADPIRSGAATDPPVYGGDTIVVGDSTIKSVWKTTLSSIGLFSVVSKL